ncbi:LacI family DNA-binding transcriptional regulator [Salana multivorans]
MEGKRPTLASVAAAAGVSRQTVSNVLNAPDLVLPDTRRRVLDAIEESGYRRNLAARQLRTRRSNQIGLAVRPAGDGASRQVLDEFLHRLVQEAQRLEYRVVMFAVEDDAAEIEGFASLMATSDIDGFVLTDTNDDDPRTDWLTERDVPFVAFGRPWGDDDATHAWIDVDGAAGVREATEHLIDLGYQRIAFLGWAEGGSGRDRRSGWLEALQARGVAGEPLERAVVGDSTAGATLASRELFDAGADAVVCASDALAIGALVTARERLARGTLRAPIGLVGFDDSPVAQALGLSSVSQPIQTVAQLAIRSLLDQLSGAGGPAIHELVAPSLRARSSSRFRLEESDDAESAAAVVVDT